MAQNSEAPPTCEADSAKALPRHDVRRLTRGGPAAELELDGTVYTLRITRQNKLILNK